MSAQADQPHYLRVPHVERQLSAGRRLVQALDAQTPAQLAGSAPLIWDLLAEHATPEELASMLQQQFSDPPEVIASGVEAGLSSLIEASLVVEQ